MKIKNWKSFNENLNSNKLFKITYKGFTIHDAYEDENGDYVVPFFTNPPSIRTVEEKRFSKDDKDVKVLEYYPAKLKATERLSDTGMVHEIDRNFENFIDRDLIARPAHWMGKTRVYVAYNEDGKLEYFTDQEIDVDENSPIKYKSNWEKIN